MKGTFHERALFLHHLPHPPLLFHCAALVGGSESFPGNKSRTWPAGFDVYFNRPFTPRCSAFFCVSPGTSPPNAQNYSPEASSCAWPQVKGCPVLKPLTQQQPLALLPSSRLLFLRSSSHITSTLTALATNTIGINQDIMNFHGNSLTWLLLCYHLCHGCHFSSMWQMLYISPTGWMRSNFWHFALFGGVITFVMAPWRVRLCLVTSACLCLSHHWRGCDVLQLLMFNNTCQISLLTEV